MSIQEYYHVFETILYASVLTLLVRGWSNLILHKSEYNSYWAYTLGSIAFCVLLILKYYIFQSFEFYDEINSPFDLMILVFAPAAALLLGANIYFPTSYKNVDLKKHLLDNRYWIALQEVTISLAIIYHVYLSNITSAVEIYIFTAGSIPGWILFAITRSLKVFEWLMVLGTLGLIYFLFQDASYYEV